MGTGCISRAEAPQFSKPPASVSAARKRFPLTHELMLIPHIKMVSKVAMASYYQIRLDVEQYPTLFHLVKKDYGLGLDVFQIPELYLSLSRVSLI